MWNIARMFFGLTLLTGILYPLLITLIAQLTMNERANGSLIFQQNSPIGSHLIGQKFTNAHYFWGRPSAIDYQPLPSGGSNLGPTSSELKKIITERQSKFEPNSNIPSELLFASGSGVDPHISVPTAYFQIPRIASARHFDPQMIKTLIDQLAKRQYAFFGEAYVNVLQLNMALDSINNQ